MRLIIRYTTLASAVALCAVALGACGSGGNISAGSTATSGGASTAANAKATGTLRIMAEVGLTEPKVMKPFEEANPGVKVEVLNVEGTSESATKLAAGFKTDIVETCADESHILMQRELLTPIDTSKLEHWSELSPVLRTGEGITVDGKQMFVPGMAGPEVLIYNTKDFPHGVDTFKELFNPALKGKVALSIGGDYKAIIATTAFALGIKDPFAMDPAELHRVGKYLDAHTSQFRTFTHSSANDSTLMKSGEIVMTNSDIVNAREMVEAGVPVKWSTPKEGYYSWVCGLGIASTVQNLPAAYAFLNYYTSASTQASFGNRGYTIVNEKAVSAVKPSLRKTADPNSFPNAVVESYPSKATAAEWLQVFQEVVG